MLKYYNYDIVFQEIPDEVTLAVNISGCPCRCPGCHSPHLWEDCGERLDEAAIREIYAKYDGSVSCICLMGGDGDPVAVERLCRFIRQELGLRSGWWSGRDRLPAGCRLEAFDYVKTGAYRAESGGLKNPATNQRLYRVEAGGLRDITARFWRGQDQLK